MRPPRLDLLTLKRAAGKLANWMKLSHSAEHSNQEDTKRPTIIDTKMWPWMRRPWDRWINQKLLVNQLRVPSKGCIAISTIPIVADLIEQLPVKKWVYYCVDDFSSWPGLDGATLLKQERDLLSKVDQVVCASETLMEKMKNLGLNANLLTHGVDAAQWSYPSDSLPASDFGITTNEKFALFWGVIDRRMNADWLIALADQVSNERIVLAGPTQDPDPRLLNHPKIQLIGSVPFPKLPALAKLAKVLIMPYDDLPVTRAMQPLKLKEYLSTLKPVVTSDLPAVRPWQDCLEMASSRDEFVDLVISLLRSTNQDSEKKDLIKNKMVAETWQGKADQFAEWFIQ